MRRTAPPAVTMPPLDVIMRFERTHPRNDPTKFGQISTTFRMNSARYFQHLNGVIETKEALELDPLTVHRLRRMRDESAREYADKMRIGAPVG